MQRMVAVAVVTASCILFPALFARDVATKSSKFYIYRSTNNGASWQAAEVGPPLSKRVNALAVDVAKSYAGTDEGVFVSSDNGRTWSRAAMGPSHRVQSLVAGHGAVYAGTARGVYVSQDHGRTWAATLRGLNDLNVRALATDDTLVFAGTDKGGVYVLRGAGHWQKYGRGLPDNSQVFDLATTQLHLYAALYGKGLYRTSTDGEWRKVGEVRPLEVVARGDVIVAGHNPGGIQQSVDGGKTWRTASGLSGPSPIWGLGEAGQTLFAGTSPGAVLRSEDSGASWRISAVGLPSDAAVVAVTGDRAIALAAIVVQN